MKRTKKMLKLKEELEKKILRLKKKSTDALKVSNLKRINRIVKLILSSTAVNNSSMTRA